MKRFFQVLTVVLALFAVAQVVTSKPEAVAGTDGREHSEPGI